MIHLLVKELNPKTFHPVSSSESELQIPLEGYGHGFVVHLLQLLRVVYTPRLHWGPFRRQVVHVLVSEVCSSVVQRDKVRDTGNVGRLMVSGSSTSYS